MKRDTRWRVGGHAGLCAVPLMEMDAGSKLSPEQRLDDWREGEGGDPFLLLLPPWLQDSFNEGGVAAVLLVVVVDEHSRLDLRKGGRGELQRGWDGREKKDREGRMG